MTPEAKKALLDQALDAMANAQIQNQYNQMTPAFGSVHHQLSQLANQGAFHGGYRQAPAPLPGYSPYPPYHGPGTAGFSASALPALVARGPGSLISIGAGTASPPEPIEDAGIRPGEVRAYRCWLVQQGFLRSVAVGDVWAPGEPMIGKPTETSYGVHAWKSMSKALTYSIAAHEVVVVGQVELWGDIVEHEHGYRAENAAIVSLDGILGGKGKDGARLLEALRRRYGVGGGEEWVEETTERWNERDEQLEKAKAIMFTPLPPGPSWYEGMGIIVTAPLITLAILLAVSAFG